MIDIHTHILHSVDDGSDTLNESVAILKSAKEYGVTEIICTPHYLGKEEFNKKKIEENFKELTKRVEKEKIDIKLHLGTEIAVYGRIDKTFDVADLVKLNNSKYVLIEFPMAVNVDYVLDTVYEFKIRGIIPIIAHPERCECFKRDYDLILDAINEGALIQCNIDSLLGNNGMNAKRITRSLLKSKKVHFMSTDTHSISNNRYERLNKAMRKVEKISGTEYMNDVFCNNAKCIIENKEIGE